MWRVRTIPSTLAPALMKAIRPGNASPRSNLDALVEVAQRRRDRDPDLFDLLDLVTRPQRCERPGVAHIAQSASRRDPDVAARMTEPGNDQIDVAIAARPRDAERFDRRASHQHVRALIRGIDRCEHVEDRLMCRRRATRDADRAEHRQRARRAQTDTEVRRIASASPTTITVNASLRVARCDPVRPTMSARDD